jgi:hypothetical protein
MKSKNRLLTLESCLALAALAVIGAGIAIIFASRKKNPTIPENHRITEREIDRALEMTFPASDPLAL